MRSSLANWASVRDNFQDMRKEKAKSGLRPVPGRRFGLKFPDERRTEGLSTQTTYKAEVQGLVAEFISRGMRRSEFAAVGG